MLLRRRKMLAMMNFGILINNYKNPLVITPRDVFKRLMFTSWTFLKRYKMKRGDKQSFANKEKNKKRRISTSLTENCLFNNTQHSHGYSLLIKIIYPHFLLNTTERLKLNIVALIIFPNITDKNKQWIFDGKGGK